MRVKEIILTTLLLLIASGAFADYSGTITYEIDLKIEEGAKTAKLWIPYPLSDEYQKITDVQINGNYGASGVYRDPDSEAVFFYAGWDGITEKPFAELRFHVLLKDRTVRNIHPTEDPIPADIQKYLKASEWMPADDPEMKAIAKKATAGKRGFLARAQGVYDWVVENTFRDPDVEGCGFGIPGITVFQCNGGGKCADISAVYVTVARAAGIPARDVYGLRLADPKNGDITSGFHCWAEFYLPGTGWVPVDPADVRKMMLAHDLALKDAGEWRNFFWGGDDLFRVVLEKNARGVVFEPEQTGAPLNYFMYPFAQIDGISLDFFDPEAFSYSVVYKSD